MTGPSSVCTGVCSFLVTSDAVHPGTGWVATELIGWSEGKLILSRVVEAVADSVGTRKVSTP